MNRRQHTERCLGGGSSHDACCPYCYENRKQRANHKGHRYYVSHRIRTATYEEMNMQRPSQAARPKKGDYVCPDSDFQLTYPELARGLCDPWWDDGKPREPWTIKLSMRDDGVMLCVSDKESKLVSFTTSTSLIEGLAAIEEALTHGGLSWRKSKW